MNPFEHERQNCQRLRAIFSFNQIIIDKFYNQFKSDESKKWYKQQNRTLTFK